MRNLKKYCRRSRFLAAYLVLLAAALAPPPAVADDYYSEVVLSYGPAHYWRLGESSGNTANNEMNSRNGSYEHSPSLGETSPIEGTSDTAVRFNGSNEYVSVNKHASLRLTTGMTLMAWVKGDSWDSGSDVDVLLRKGEDNPNNYQLAIADGHAAFYLDDSDTNGYRGDTSLDTGEWYFVAATWDGSQVRVFVNGQQDHALPYTKNGNIGWDNRDLYIGGRDGADLLDGTLDEVVIFDFALSAADILDIYEAAFPEPQVYYVRPDGSDSNDGDSPAASDAWRTVEAAVEMSEIREGDTIYVMAGTYVGSVDPSIDGSSGNPITLIADTSGAIFGTAGAVVLESSGDDEAFDFDNVDYLTFRGFTIDGDSCDNQAIELDDCEGIVLDRCIVTGADKEGIDVDSSTLTLVNCLIYENGQRGLDIVGNSSNVTVLNCTIVDNGDDGVRHDDGDLLISNSIIANNGKDGLERKGGNITHTYNLVDGNNNNDFKNLSAHWSEIEANPQFIDASADNYQLQASSPAVDAGTDLTGVVDDDLLGVARPVGGGFDLGCYEFPLLGQWYFEETSGTTVYDSSGGGNHGTLSGGLSFSSDSVSACATAGYALDFDGSSDYIEVSNASSLQITSALTVMAWVRGDTWGSGSDNNVIIRKGDWTPNNYAFAIADGHVTLFLDDSDTNGYRGDTELETGAWYHVAATWDGQYVRIYVNGLLDHATPYSHSAPLDTDTRPLYLGGRAGGDYFEGLIDNIQLYGYAFSAEEIAVEYGLLAYWPLDETSGSTAYDSGPNGLDATLQSNPQWRGDGGQTGGALEFDGYNDYLEVPNSSVHYIDAYSISGWFKLDNSFNSSSGTSQILLEKYYSGDYDMLLALAGDDYNQGSVPEGAMVFKMENNAGARYHWTERTTWQAGVWYHFAIVHDGNSGGRMEIYIDGVEDTASGGVGTSSSINLEFNAPLHFGGRYADGQLSGDRYLNGMLDELRLFGRPLCAEEIAAASAGGLGASGGSRVVRWVEIP